MPKTNIEQVSLLFQEGGSDKEYHVQLVETPEGFEVPFQYGRRGSALTSGTKTPQPVAEPVARKTYEKLVGEKVRKGYQPMAGTEAGGGYSAVPTVAEVIPGRIPQLLNEVPEAVLMALLRDPDWLVQEKYDGRRLMIGNESGTVVATNRKGRAVSVPEQIVRAFQSFGEQPLLLDGELLADRFVAFDLLRGFGIRLDGPNGILSSRLTAVYRHLSSRPGIEIAPTPGFGIPRASPEYAQSKLDFFKALRDSGKEGVVLKHVSSRYTPGRPNYEGSVRKFKFYATLTARVLSRHVSKRSVALELFDPQRDQWIPVGNVTIPANHAIPAIGEQAEIRYLYAYPDGGSLYQPVYLGVRDDLDPSSAQYGQLKFKPDSAVSDDSDEDAA
ncbi:WGR domain-containing protein [Thiomonas sp.]